MSEAIGRVGSIGPVHGWFREGTGQESGKKVGGKAENFARNGKSRKSRGEWCWIKSVEGLGSSQKREISG